MPGGGMGFGLGYLLKKLKGYRNGGNGGNDFTFGIILFVAGLSITIINGVATGISNCARRNDFVEDPKSQLNATVAASMKYRSVDVTSFDWMINNDEEYIFNFSGNAINMDGEKIDFFSCAYEVSEKQYNDVVEFIETNNIKGLDSKDLIVKLNDIIKTAQRIDGKGAVVDLDNVEDDNTVILNVSKAKVKGDTVSYYVCYVKETKDKNGNLALTTIVDEVSYELTDELKKNPNGAFALSNKDAKVKTVSSEQIPMKIGDVRVFGNTANKKMKM